MVIDSHCHLSDPVYRNVRETLGTAVTHDVWGVVAVGADPASNARTLEAAAVAPKAIWACLGFHPERTALTDEDLERVEAQVREHHARIVGLGEIGLPWYALDAAPDPVAVMRRGRQRLERLLALAARYDLAVSLHAPQAAAVVAFDLLQRHGLERAVFHWHKATAEVTRLIVDAGYFVSVTPEVVYRERDRELVAAVPLTALLVESDGPWPYRGEFEGFPSGPWLASRVAEEVAKIKCLPVDEVMFQLGVNACRVFDLVWT